MKRNVFSILAILIFCSIFAEASINIDGQLYSGNMLNITDSSYDSMPIAVTGDSIVNVYYYDEIVNVDNLGIYKPALHFNLVARGNATINFIIPENDNFSFYLWDTEGNLPENFIDIYAGLQLDSSNYSTINFTQLFRYYGENVPQILTPVIGSLKLQDSAVVNFVPEPTSFLLLAMGGLLIRKGVVG